MTPNWRVTWQATSDDETFWPRSAAPRQPGRSRRARSRGAGTQNPRKGGGARRGGDQMMWGRGGLKRKLPRRNFLHLAASAAALPVLSRIARAQAYPARPVRLIVPVAPAG